MSSKKEVMLTYEEALFRVEESKKLKNALVKEEKLQQRRLFKNMFIGEFNKWYISYIEGHKELPHVFTVSSKTLRKEYESEIRNELETNISNELRIRNFDISEVHFSTLSEFHVIDSYRDERINRLNVEISVCKSVTNSSKL